MRNAEFGDYAQHHDSPDATAVADETPMTGNQTPYVRRYSWRRPVRSLVGPCWWVDGFNLRSVLVDGRLGRC